MVIILLSMQSKKQEINAFLGQLKKMIGDERFDIENDFVLIRKHKKDEDEEFSTPYTLVQLEYDAEDVVVHLETLSIEDYSETLVDKKDLNPPLLFVFGKMINGKQVYIKLKIKGDSARFVLCVSFHYAKHPMRFPYA